MRRILTAAILTLAVTLSAQAQRRLDPERYTFPVLNVAGYCSANFGEMRPNHFHSGVDIKTDGVEGKPVVATADGYVARIVVQPSGYGRALYVVHPEGTMSVYGHMSKFRADLDSLASDRRNRSKRNAIDFYLPEGRYKVKRGEVIGLSGNTGNSFGPHLHFEIRDMRDNTTLNLIRQGIIPVRDTIAPRIEAIHYVAVDTLGIIPLQSAPRRIAVRQTGRGRYETDRPVEVAPCGYFIIETSDRKNSVTNRYGIYRVTQSIDGRPVFEYRADGFRLEEQRYCNSISYYPLQLDARCEVIRLARQEGCPEKFFAIAENRGAVCMTDERSKRITIEVEDDCRNISRLEFDVVPGGAAPQAVQIPDSLTIDRRRSFSSRFEDIAVTIPAGALYESARFDCRRSTVTPLTAGSSVSVVTPVYQIMDDRTPLHTAATVSLRAFVPSDLRKHTALATVSPKGRLDYAGGKYSNGTLTAQTRKLGGYCAVLDTVAPVIRPRFETGSDMRRRSVLTFTVSDNFSGISEYSATIDGRWVAVDRMPVQGTLNIRLDNAHAEYNTDHTIAVTVSDNCGNTAVWSGTFFR